MFLTSKQSIGNELETEETVDKLEIKIKKSEHIIKRESCPYGR